MSYEFKFPDVGEGITEGKLVKWLVKEGDSVKEDDSVAEVETDKAVVELPCPKDGVVEKLLFAAGDTLELGKVIMVLSGEGSGGEDKKEEPKKEAKPEQKEAPPAQEPAPEKKPTTPPSPSPSVPTSKEILAMPSVRRAAKEKGIDLSTLTGSGKDGRIVMEDLGGAPAQSAASSAPVIQQAAKQKPAEKPSPAPSSFVKSSKPASEILATPSTRKLARELGVDIGSIAGSGDHGRITKEDVQKATQGKAGQAPPQEQPEQAATKPAAPTPASFTPVVTGGDEVIPMSKIRQVIASRMLESQQKTATVTHSDEADVTDLVEMRAKEKEKLKAQGVKLTFLPFFIKAVISALQKHPYLNATLDEQGQNITLKHYFNMGIAVDTPDGLLVPVIQDAGGKSIVQLAQEVVDLAGKAREKKLAPSDMQGGTFTISSVGSIGGQMFTPIINYPQAAILGIGKIADKPVVKDGEIVIRKMVTLSVTYDHRILDGAEGARFMRTLVGYLEDPALLFMEMI